ncbi:MAG: MSHA biogenesis protein MshP [Rhodocyclales bacterium]|nr:MSHA biogenesis protein MshP [Rhodocyclales bacterium]
MRRQRGLGAIAAIAVLVILAALSAAIVAVGTSQHMSSAQDVLSARAWQAARAGNEWGLFQALQPGGAWTVGAASDLCPAAGALGQGTTRTTTLDLTGTAGFFVTVTGDCWRYNEGESAPGTAATVNLYRITAVACPAAACPAAGAAVASPGYVERTRVVLATN